MRKILYICFCLILPTVSAKFDGINIGVGLGGELGFISEKSSEDSADKLYGLNGKLSLGLSKTLLDTLYAGVEGFADYNLSFSKEEYVSIGEVANFGGLLRAGIIPSQNFLLFGTLGVQTQWDKFKVKEILSTDKDTWTTVIGAGLDYSIGFGVNLRLEGLYRPPIKFKIKEVTEIEYNLKYLTINAGIYLAI